MHPPAWVCREIYRIHPKLRLAWAGRPPLTPGELNPGAFAIVELYPIDHCGSMDDAKVKEEFWDVKIGMPVDNVFVTERAERGPIFSKDGRAERDWDPIFVKPVLKQVLDSDWGFSYEDVMSGRIVEYVRRRVMTLKEKRQRILKQAHEKGKALESKVSDLTREMGDFLWHEALKSDASYVDMSWKHAKENLPNRYRVFQENGMSFEDHYLKRAGG